MLKIKPCTGLENCNYFISISELEIWHILAVFYSGIKTKMLFLLLMLCWKNWFYHGKRIERLKLGCTLPNLANTYQHKSTDFKFYPFFLSDSDFLLEDIREDMTGGPSIVSTRKTLASETFIRNSKNLCKSIVGFKAIQLYTYSRCRDMPTGLYTRRDYNEETQMFKAWQNRVPTFEKVMISSN